MKQRIIAIVAAALLILAVCSCGTSGNPPASTTASAAAQTTTAAPSETTTTATTTTATTAEASSKTEAQTEKATTELAAADGAAEVEMFLDISWLPDAHAVGYNSRIGRAIMEATGVKLVITKAKTGDSEQINLLLASDDLPDMVCVEFSHPIFGALRESDRVADLMPLIKDYAPELYDTMGEGYWNFYTSDTGINNYYANCAFSPKSGEKYCAYGGWCPGLFVREDIWSAMGEPDITSPDKLKDHLIDVKDRYPDVKPIMFGSSDTLGLTASCYDLGFFKSAFGIEMYYETPDGKITAGFNHPEYGNFLAWVNGMYRDGFYTREDIAGNAEARKSWTEQGNLYMYANDNVPNVQYPPAGNPDVKYTTAPVFSTFKATQQTGIFWCATFISSKCKDPSAAIRLMSYCASQEGDRLIAWGEEGIDWEWNANGVPVYTDYYKESNAESVTQYDYQMERGFLLPFSNWSDHEWTALSIPEDAPYMKRARDLYQDMYFARLNFLSLNPVGNMPENITVQQCRDYYNEMIPQIIMANSKDECLALFETMKKELVNKGLAEVEAYWTMKSDKARNAFGADKLILRGADSVIYHKLYG